MSDYLPLTLPDIVENALGVRFEPRSFEHYDPEPAELRNLAEAVLDFYSSFPDFSKPVNVLRPYIAPRFAASSKIGEDFVLGSGPAFEYHFDPSIQGQLVSEVKRYLLYCHGVAIYDRLPSLLDYFRLDHHSDEARKRLPAVKAMLAEYAQLTELMRRGILVPLSDEALGTVFANDYQARHTDELHSRLPGLTREKLEILESLIRHGQIEVERARHSIDLFFPGQNYLDVFRELLKIASVRFTSKETAEPFKVGLLATSPGLELNRLSFNDIIQIRLNDELFERWREAVGHILERLHEDKATYTDAEREATEVAGEELRHWKEDLQRRLEKTSLISLTTTAATSATIGAVAGAVFDPVAGIGTAVLAEALQLGHHFIASRKERRTAAALRQHFLVLGVEAS